MNSISILQGILSLEEGFVDIYLNAVIQCRFVPQSNEEHSFAQNITSLLTNPRTVALGLRILDRFLETCSDDALTMKGNLWTTLVLKAYNNKHDEIMVFHILHKIVERSEKVPDLSQSFSQHIPKICESFAGLPSYKSKHALNFVETCLRLYSGLIVPCRDIVEKFLWRNIDQLDYEIVKSSGRCLHLLQMVKNSGTQNVNHKIKWKNYQLQLIGHIHSVYNKMFANCVEMFDEKIEEEKLQPESYQTQFEVEPAQKLVQIYVRCRNLVTYLGIALREPFIVEKPILIKKVINVIIRGLSVNYLILEQNPIADNIALSILLPELHTDLLNLLIIAITTLRGHLRPNSELILRLLIDELKWTSATYEIHKKLWFLREKVYDVISLWCKTFKSSNLCETIAEYLFLDIMRDITPAQNEITLTFLSSTKKNVSKRVRQQNGKHNTRKSIGIQHFSAHTNPNLTIAALRCFQEVILSVSNFLKPNTLKIMQRSISKIPNTFYELDHKSDNLYNNTNCRIEIYKTLHSFLVTTHHLCLPPTELILAIIQTAHVRDDNLKVRICCSVILRNFEKLIHSQKESLLYTIDTRNLEDTFTNTCSENFLNEVETRLQSSSCNCNKITEHDNQMKGINILIYQNSNKTQNEYEDATSVTRTESVKSQTSDTIKGKQTNDYTDATSRDACTVNENISDFFKTTELLSDANDMFIARERVTINSNINEQVKKKIKLSSECKEIQEIGNLNTSIVDEQVKEKIKLSSECNEIQEIGNLNTSIMDGCENDILHEIASQFVDELE